MSEGIFACCVWNTLPADDDDDDVVDDDEY